MLWFFCFLLLLISTGAANENSAKRLKYSLVKISIANQEDIKTILKSGVSLDDFRREGDGIVGVLNNREIQKLAELGFTYSVQIEDMIKNYEENIRLPDDRLPALQKRMKAQYGIKGFEFGSMGGYYTFDEILVELDSMRMLYPHLITVKKSVGKSLEGRDIWMVKISDNPDSTEDEPEVFFNSLIHAKEPQSMASLMYFMYYLLENYGSNPLVTYLVDNREMYFIPVINPDGYVYNEQTHPKGGGYWRKNKRDNNGNGVFEESYDGVDLNRNFGFKWGYDDLGSSANPSSLSYRGAAPFSEPESRVIRDFCTNHNFQIASVLHAAWKVIFYPYGYDLKARPPEPDLTTFIRLGSEMIKYNDYILQNPPDNYPANGDAGDWMYGEQTAKNKIYAFVYEVGPASSSWPGQNNIFRIAEGDVYPHLIMALGRGVIEPDTAFFIQAASINSKALRAGSDTLRIESEIFNADSGGISVSAIIESLDLSFREVVPLNSDLPAKSSFGNRQFSGTWIIPPGLEDYFIVSILAASLSSDIRQSQYAGKFTTLGPVLPIEPFYIDTGYNERYKIQYLTLILQNQGSQATAKNLKIKLSTTDPRVERMAGSTRRIDNLAAGQIDTTTIHNVFSFIYAEGYGPDSTFGNPIRFDVTIYSNNYPYWVSNIDFTADSNFTALSDNSVVLPEEFVLFQNYPNPFNPATVFSYQIPVACKVNLSIYNLLGQRVATLVSAKQPAGAYRLEWNATGFASGIYFYRLETDKNFAQTGKLVLLK